MNQTRPYWKVIVSLLLHILATVLFVVAGIGLLRLFFPFVIGWCIACIANPMVCWLEKKLKLVKKFGTALIIILVLGGVVGALYFGIAKLANETTALIQNIPDIYMGVDKELNRIGTEFQGVFRMLPEQVQRAWTAISNSMDDTIGTWVGKLSEPTFNAAGNLAMQIPSIFIGTIVSIISAYFFVADREEVLEWVKKVTPPAIEHRMSLVLQTMKVAVGGYFKAQFQIMLVLWAMMFLGFCILGVNYAILLAFLFAFLDFLPFLGTAITLVPWAIYQAFQGNYKMTVGLLIIYILTQLTRQIIQPKLVGDRVGLKPLPTLFLLYLGYKMGSVVGMIFAVPVGMILLHMYEAGAFDYILNDVNILVQGILKLRE